MAESSESETWDCIIVGGGAAGLSAALVLGRARRRALLIDAGEQSNLPDPGVGGLLGHEGRPPAELYEAGRRDLNALPTSRSVPARFATVTLMTANSPWSSTTERGRSPGN